LVAAVEFELLQADRATVVRAARMTTSVLLFAGARMERHS
jgi:hypothetical protein